MSVRTEPLARQRGRTRIGRELRKALPGLLFILPALLLYAVFFIQPFLVSIYYSMTDWSGARAEKSFIGLDNYRRLLSDPLLHSALAHNLVWVVIGTVVPIVIGLLLATLLWSGARGRLFFRTVYFLPVVLADVVIGVIWHWIYHPLFGPINRFLRGVGLGSLARGWLGQPDTALLAVIAAAIWGYFGFAFVVLLAGLQNVNMELVEAATIDGANRWQRFWHVIIPELGHVLTMITAITLMGGFSVFGIVFVLTAGGPGTATQVIATYTYRQAFQENNIGYGSALSMVMTVITLIVSYVFIRLRERSEA